MSHKLFPFINLIPGSSFPGWNGKFGTPIIFIVPAIILIIYSFFSFFIFLCLFFQKLSCLPFINYAEKGAKDIENNDKPIHHDSDNHHQQHPSSQHHQHHQRLQHQQQQQEDTTKYICKKHSIPSNIFFANDFQRP
ncbi:hypothetical protein ACFFRR_002096 [Megaselia abdita]